MYHSPVILYDDMCQNDSKVKRRTGFLSLANMLAYIMVVCNGDNNKMKYKHTSLTWLEEWFLFFEIVWGRTLYRMMDAAAVYKVDQTSVRLIFEKKLEMVLACRKRWPTYASAYSEDHKLTKQKWRDRFKDKKSCHVG